MGGGIRIGEVGLRTGEMEENELAEEKSRHGSYSVVVQWACLHSWCDHSARRCGRAKGRVNIVAGRRMKGHD